MAVQVLINNSVERMSGILNKNKSVIVEVDEVTRGIMEALEDQMVTGINTAIYQGTETVSDEMKTVKRQVAMGVKGVTDKIISLEKVAEQNLLQIQNINELIENINEETNKSIEQLGTQLKEEIGNATSIMKTELENIYDRYEKMTNESKKGMGELLNGITSMLDKQSQLITTLQANQEAILAINKQLPELSDRIRTLEKEVIWLGLPFYKKIGRTRKELKMQ